MKFVIRIGDLKNTIAGNSHWVHDRNNADASADWHNNLLNMQEGQAKRFKRNSSILGEVP
jgi:hypothetical protein